MLIEIPDINIAKEEIKILLAIKLMEEGLVSLGKAAEISGLSERAFVELLLARGYQPIKYSDIDIIEEIQHA